MWEQGLGRGPLRGVVAAASPPDSPLSPKPLTREMASGPHFEPPLAPPWLWPLLACPRMAVERTQASGLLGRGPGRSGERY